MSIKVPCLLILEGLLAIKKTFKRLSFLFVCCSDFHHISVRHCTLSFFAAIVIWRRSKNFLKFEQRVDSLEFKLEHSWGTKKKEQTQFVDVARKICSNRADSTLAEHSYSFFFVILSLYFYAYEREKEWEEGRTADVSYSESLNIRKRTFLQVPKGGLRKNWSFRKHFPISSDFCKKCLNSPPFCL